MDIRSKKRKERLRAASRKPVADLNRTFLEFTRLEASGGIVLMAAAVVALIWANSPWAQSYDNLWRTPLAIRVGGFGLEHNLHWWVNDALMVIFFFVVGLENKREILVGELSSFKQAALPIVAAVGGMLVPAAVYAFINRDGLGSAGWGVPMATDIAFALGVMALAQYLRGQLDGGDRVYHVAVHCRAGVWGGQPGAGGGQGWHHRGVTAGGRGKVCAVEAQPGVGIRKDCVDGRASEKNVTKS